MLKVGILNKIAQYKTSIHETTFKAFIMSVCVYASLESVNSLKSPRTPTSKERKVTTQTEGGGKNIDVASPELLI